MSLPLARIAELVGGHLCGDAQILISDAVILRDAGPAHITLVESEKYTEQLALSKAAAAIVPRGFPAQDIPTIVVDAPREAFAQAVAQFRPAAIASSIGVSEHANIAASAVVADDCSIQANANVGENVRIGSGSLIHSGAHIMSGCMIGKDVVIFPGAVLYANTVIGDRSVIHANAVIGAFGFGYEMVDGQHKLCSQLGNVVIGQDVEIGAGTTIDRGSYGATTIGDGTKIDNQVMIGHNCRIGKHNLLCAQVGIAGSCSTGDYVVMAGQVGLRDHTSIGDRAQIGAKAGVATDLEGGQQYLGAPALPARQQMQIIFAQQKLPELKKKIRQLERQMTEISAIRHPKSEAA